MMNNAATATMDVVASDVTGQKKVRATGISPQSTVRELVQGLLGKMGLVTHGTGGEVLQYRARLKRDGRHLRGGELVGDALRPDDEVTLQPRINAG